MPLPSEFWDDGPPPPERTSEEIEDQGILVELAPGVDYIIRDDDSVTWEPDATVP